MRKSLLKWEEFPKKDAVVLLGNSVGEITERAAEYLSSHKMPEGIIMDNYQVSIGVLTVLRKLGIRAPKELKLVGIDEVPEYAVPDVGLTQVKIPHVERAAVAMSLLKNKYWIQLLAISFIGNAMVLVNPTSYAILYMAAVVKGIGSEMRLCPASCTVCWRIRWNTKAAETYAGSVRIELTQKQYMAVRMRKV